MRERERDRKMYCQSCREEYGEEEAGTCKECYEEASETEEELKREIDDLRSRLFFLRLPSPTLDASSIGHSDLLLNAIPASSSSLSPSSADPGHLETPAVQAHHVILVSLFSPFALAFRRFVDAIRFNFGVDYLSIARFWLGSFSPQLVIVD